MFVEFVGEYRTDKILNQKALKDQDAVLERIAAQATKTNGRVTRLEKWKLIVVTVLATCGGVGALVGWFAMTQLTFLRDLSELRLKQIIREEINAPSHIDKLKGALRRKEALPQLTRHP